MLGLGATLMMVRALNQAALGNPKKLGNVRVLEDAKAALLIYVEKKAIDNNHPGQLPCPEETAFIGTANEGRSQLDGFCTLPAVGRLPWKTLGLAAAPLDMDGEQLWYTLSPGFNAASDTGLVINSNTPAGLTVDGSPARAVALIFAPGRPMSGQTRPTVSNGSPPVASNYLEGVNAVLGTSFATYGPANSSSSTFNDQAMIVTHQDLFAIVEPVVARRLSETMVNGTKPLTAVYASSSWGTSSSAPVFPFAVPFGDPDTSTYEGVSGTTQGLLPMTYSTTSDATQYCNPATDGPRCNPTFVQWTSFGSLAKTSGTMTVYASPAPTCTVAASQLSCTVYTNTSGSYPTLRLVATASNVAMALRQLDSDAPSTTELNATGRSISAVINADGSATMTFTAKIDSFNSGTNVIFTCFSAPFPWNCQRRTFSIPIRIFSDHPIVNSSDSEYGWFTKNEWHKLTYFAIASGFSASGSRSCTSPNCLTINNLGTTPNNDKRAVLILAGRPIGTQTRSSGTLSNYLESENLSPVDNAFEILKPSRTFNDRVVVVDTN